MPRCARSFILARLNGACAVAALAAAVLAVIACGPLSPPEACVATGAADEAAFAQRFTAMALLPETQARRDDRPLYRASDALQIAATATQTASVRLCIEEDRGGGSIAFDQLVDAVPGDNLWDVRSFPSGPYVVRVIADGVLVRNLPLAVE